MGIDGDVVTISPFWVDVPSLSESVRLGAKFPRTEADDEVEMGEVFRPAGLPTREDFCRREICKVFVVRHNINRKSGALEVVAPDTESFKNSQEFLVVDVVIELQSGEGAGVKSDRVEFPVRSYCGENCTQGVVGGIRFDDELSARGIMGEDRSSSKGCFEAVEGLATSGSEVPRCILASKVSKGNGDAGVVANEMSVEVSKTKKRLNILNLPGFWPIQNGLDLGLVHSKPVGREDIPEVFNRILMPIAFIGTCI